jgi:hypothetical protein
MSFSVAIETFVYNVLSLLFDLHLGGRLVEFVP